MSWSVSSFFIMNESGKSEFTVLAFPNQEIKGEDINGFLEEKAKKAV